ncbi:MAG: SPOR domain-containing protein [Candidatus Omnitrophica bacterium]|nr:SPOR domain-containing protein [Candidatus Omnitrophota bacterium]
MENDPAGQLELFSDSGQKTRASSVNRKDNQFAGYIWKYEKAVLLIIAFLVVGIISYSLGVERGKRNQKQPVIISNEALMPKIETEELAQDSGYTIQVASFKTDSYARKEAAMLKEKGYKASVLHRGEYVIVCVGNFKNKEEAQSLIPELGRYYKDCRIRRL